MSGALEAMQGATPLVRRVTMCLDGSALAEYDDLLAELPQAAIKDQSLAQERVTQIRDRLEEIREQMQASEVVFTFAAMPWMERLTLQAQHPPRDGNLLDRGMGYNVETYVPALIKAACRSAQGPDGVVIVEIPDEQWESTLRSLNGNQVDVLFGAASQANDHATTVPLSARSLLGSQDSGASSKSPSPGTSPRNASKAGSRRGSRKSTATKKAASSA